MYLYLAIFETNDISIFALAVSIIQCGISTEYMTEVIQPKFFHSNKIIKNLNHIIP